MKFWRYVKKVLWLSRTGWLQSGVPPSMAETVAQHSFTSAMLALEISFRIKSSGISIDPYKSALIALTHDLTEGYIGDLPKYSSSIIDKRKLEEAPLKEMGPELGLLIEEFLNQSSIESKVAKLSDYLSTALMAREYLKMGFNVEDILESSVEGAKRIAEELNVGIDDLLHGLVEGLS